MGFHALDHVVGSRTLRAPESTRLPSPLDGIRDGCFRGRNRPLLPRPGPGVSLPPPRPLSPVEPVRPASPAPAGGASRVIGVLGGIASGKTLVARLLAGPAGLVLAADEIAHEVLDSPELRPLLLERFGPEVVGADGRIDRSVIARSVFAPGGGGRRSELEGWTHPRVRDRIWARLEQARASGVPRIVLDVPLLLENDAQHGLARACDALVFVDVPEAERDRRARESRGWAAGEVARREAAQWPLAEKRRRAHHVIPNTDSPETLRADVENVARALDLP
jgi:dephospho-CoA kinase